MSLDQEIASVINFALISAGNPTPYYWNVPEGFIVPAMYFPVPEIESSGATLYDYALTYIMFVTVFAKESQDAHELAFLVLNAIKKRRGAIPLIDENGEYTGRIIRLGHPTSKIVEGKLGTVQLMLSWESPRSYHYEEQLKTRNPKFNIMRKAFARATGEPDPETDEDPELDEYPELSEDPELDEESEHDEDT